MAAVIFRTPEIISRKYDNSYTDDRVMWIMTAIQIACTLSMLVFLGRHIGDRSRVALRMLAGIWLSSGGTMIIESIIVHGWPRTLVESGRLTLWGIIVMIPPLPLVSAGTAFLSLSLMTAVLGLTWIHWRDRREPEMRRL
jgi:hypothetical protein